MHRWNIGMVVAGVCASAVALAGCGSSGSSTSSSSELPGQAAVQQATNDLVAAGAPGVLVVAQRGDNVVNVTSGVADVDSKTAMTSSAVARIASVSKPFSAAIVLDLAGDGKLSLDAPISQLLSTVPKQWGAATISQVLQHTSGIPDYIKDETFLQQFVADPLMQRTPQQLVDYVAKKPLAFKPGTQYEYSDTDNIIAGLIAEQLLGKPYDQILSELVTSPLSLSSTSLPSTPALPSGFIHGYARETEGASSAVKLEDVSQAINPALAWASGGMTSTGADLNSFVRGMLAGKLFDASVLTNSSAFVPGAGGPPGPGENFSGVGIYRYQTACGTVFGHTGNMPGYTAFIASDQTGSNSLSVIVNTQISEKAAPQLFEKLLAVENAAICSIFGQAQPSASSSS